MRTTKKKIKSSFFVNNLIMQGRVFKLKKTTILSISFYFAITAFLVSTVLSVVLIRNYYAWFFFFCLFVGLHLLVKSLLFHLDSCCYFGLLLFFIGAFGIIVQFLNLLYFQSVYYLLAFAFASYFTYCFFNQKFHLVLAFSFFLVDVVWFFYKINLVSIWIFIAFVGLIVLSFVLRYLLKNFLKKS